MRRVKLYGQLAEFVGCREISADVSTVSESVRMLAANFDGIEQHMASQSYQITVGGESIGEEELDVPMGKEDILIIPVVEGAGDVGKILLGAVLIATAFYMPGGIKVAGGFKKLEAASWGAKALFGLGSMLALTGIANMLTPTPETPEDTEDPRKSFNFSGVTNTNAAGVPVPVVMGLTLTGSVVISAGMDTVQVDT